MEHYFSRKPTSDIKKSRIKVNIKGLEFELHTASGVFSKSRLDPASRLLIESVNPLPGARLLDLGCGYGVIGIALKKIEPSINLTLSDVNKRALSLAKKNLKSLGLDAEVLESDAYENINHVFDMILTNPPQKAGKDVCEKIILESPHYLKDGGRFIFVARHNRGGKSLQKVLKSTYKTTKVRAKKGGFRVYAGEKT